jgi:hypothetical protein
MTSDVLKKYKSYMEECFFPYYSKEQFEECFKRVPKFRYDTFNYCWDTVRKNNFKTIVELGTTRSFVDGKYEGCNSDDVKYWEPENPDKWDWSAGCFTRVFGELIQGTDIELITVDMSQYHIQRSKTITSDMNNIEYIVMSSEEFLSSGEGKIDFLYMDTGDMTPIESTAQLHLREAKIIVEKDIISDGGILLIDDVRSPLPKMTSNETSDYGKAKYSIPYLQENGFEIVIDEYQVLMIKK